MTISINFTIIIPWFGGNPVREVSLQNMLRCLPMQITRDANDPIIYDVIIVEQVTEQIAKERAERIVEIVPDNIPNCRYIPVVKEGAFNKSWCMNVGARKSETNHLIFMDADSLFGNDYFLTMKFQIRSVKPPRNKIMFCWNYIICLPGKDNPVSRHIRPDTTFAMGGIWYAEKDFYFNEFGGMNENFESYGGEDNEAYERACFAIKSGAVAYMPYPLAHQYHHWEAPSENCSKLFNITKFNPETIINRLRSVNLGNKEAPTLIEMEDLKHEK